MKIYTRTGDSGMTSIVGGARLPKNDPRIEAYGTVDELNCHMGILASGTDCDRDSRKIILGIQHTLFNIGAYLAGAEASGVTADDILSLENDIDRMDGIIPPLRAFVLPGGSSLSARAQLARAVARRAERRVYYFRDAGGSDVAPELLKYINRLSDWLFVFARYCNVRASVPEVTWHG